MTTQDTIVPGTTNRKPAQLTLVNHLLYHNMDILHGF